MTEVRIRNVDGWVVESLRQRARANGRSLEAELKDVLRQEAQRPKLEMAEELRQMRGELRTKYGTFTESADEIRAMRDERG